MNSIDELRNEICVLRNHYNIDTNKLVRIADAIERELEERYIEGPTDKNGDPITYRTMIHQWGALEYIACEMYPDGTYEWFVRGHDTSAPLEKAKHVTVIKPPTVEDVLEKALNEAAMLDRKEGYWPSAEDITNIVNELAPKLQLREEGE